MDSMIYEQLRLFSLFFFSGFIIGILFDIFRIIRKSFKISDLHTFIEDFLFSIITTLFLIFLIFVYNTGNLRFYMIIALTFGFSTYIITLSKYFIKINVILINLSKIFISKILHIFFIPLKFFLKYFEKILKKPIMFLIINLKKLKILLIYKKSNKKIVQKKDFKL